MRLIVKQKAKVENDTMKIAATRYLITIAFYLDPYLPVHLRYPRYHSYRFDFIYILLMSELFVPDRNTFCLNQNTFCLNQNTLFT